MVSIKYLHATEMQNTNQFLQLLQTSNFTWLIQKRIKYPGTEIQEVCVCLFVFKVSPFKGSLLPELKIYSSKYHNVQTSVRKTEC